jgi:hypothetical protein
VNALANSQHSLPTEDGSVGALELTLRFSRGESAEDFDFGLTPVWGTRGNDRPAQSQAALPYA